MNPLDSSELLKARDRLKSGDVVAIPTETVYGLAASISSEQGLQKLFSLKERPFFDPLIVHVASFKEAVSVVKEWPPLVDFIARMFWPGPLTLVLPKADHVNPLITSGLETVAVRYPAHPIAQELIRLSGSPLAAPSANKFGRTSPSTAAHVRSEFSEQDLLVIDGGKCEVGIESTVIAFGKNDRAEDEIQILRPGGITEEMLREKLSKWFGSVHIKQVSSQASPGHLKHHYMPKIPLVIIGTDEPQGLSETSRHIISRALSLSEIRLPRELKLHDEATQAARELYSEMRRVAESGADLIYVKAPQESSRKGLWEAIWDRLSRAASLDLSAEK